MRRLVAARSLCIALALCALAGGDGSAGHDKVVRSAARCVHYKQKMAPDDGGVDFWLTNRCRFDVGCSIEWDLRCGSSKTSQTHASTNLSIAADDTGDAHASAAACDRDWEIRKCALDLRGQLGFTVITSDLR